ncbi:MAG: ATP-binding protein [Candidatus Woesearchaeota archaeon]
MGIVDSARLLFPLTAEQKRGLSHFGKFLSKDDIGELSRLLKQKKIRLSGAKIGLSERITDDDAFTICEIADHRKNIVDFVESCNSKSETHRTEHLQKEFRTRAFETITGIIAPNLLGFDNVKKASALQLFGEENIHILLIGDTGTGKTEILLSAHDLAPVSSFGLGSGTSGIGLTVTVRGKEIHKGILPLANRGVACIDELNLIKKEDVGSLYNAMEKGFVSYNKMGHHYRFEARTSILATANPRYNTFVGKTAQQLRKEMPFDAALLTRFHLIFFFRKPDLEKFGEIAKKIVGQKSHSVQSRDVNFIKGYIEKAREIEVSLPQEFENTIVEFAKKIKKMERKLLVEVSPRMVAGIVRLAKASARTGLRNKVDDTDIRMVLEIVESSLKHEAN